MQIKSSRELKYNIVLQIPFFTFKYLVSVHHKLYIFITIGIIHSNLRMHWVVPTVKCVIIYLFFCFYFSVNQGLSIQLNFDYFNTYYADVLNIYEGMGSSKILRGKLKQIYSPLSKWKYVQNLWSRLCFHFDFELNMNLYFVSKRKNWSSL